MAVVLWLPAAWVALTTEDTFRLPRLASCCLAAFVSFSVTVAVLPPLIVAVLLATVLPAAFLATAG